MATPSGQVNDEVCALDAVTLEIGSGETVGIIGRNGSGKTTLLRMIAGIVHPTSGQIKVNGRISAVLDISSGLHPRLTGRENIRLKGAIYGLDQHEIDDRMEAIIDFSGLGDFVDRPISIYSSGMVIRLGFSIAMHMDFDILLMDEVLAVGDIVFQRQCLARVRRFMRAGKTIVLASHNLADIAAIAKRVVMLKHGRVEHDAETEFVLKAYHELSEKEENRIPRHLLPFHLENVYGTDSGEIYIERVDFMNSASEKTDLFRTGESMVVVIQFRCQAPVDDPLFRVQFFRSDGLWVHGANTARVKYSAGVLRGEGEIQLVYERLNLLDGDYFITVGVWPDEHRSSLTDIAYDCHPWSHVIRVRSSREDGAGIVSNPFSWRLTRNDGTDVEEAPLPSGLENN